MGGVLSIAISAALGGDGGGGTCTAGAVISHNGIQPQQRSRVALRSPRWRMRNNVGLTIAWTYDM